MHGPYLFHSNPALPNWTMQVHLSAILLGAIRLAHCTTQGYLPDLPYTFTLSAVNATSPNTDLTGAPLVLGQNGGPYI